jgi:predicted amidohydrolase
MVKVGNRKEATTITSLLNMRVAVAQIHPPTADIAASLAKLRWLFEGLKQSADLLVLPECWLTGYHLTSRLARELAVPVLLHEGTDEKNPLDSVAALASEFGMAIIIGFIERGRGCFSDGVEPLYNSLALVCKSGKLRGLYRKTHLWGAFERAIYEPGPGVDISGGFERKDMPAFVPAVLPEFPEIPIGLLICFDMEFPEPSRLLALAGAKLIVASTAMGEREAFSSRVFARARACENHVAFVFSNYPSYALLALCSLR